MRPRVVGMASSHPAGRSGTGGRLPPAGEPLGQRRGLDGPVEVAEAVGEGSGQVPSVRRLLRRVGGGDDHDPFGQVEVADDPLEHDPQQRGLHSGRRGGDLVEKEQPLACRGQPLGPPGRCHVHLGLPDDRQPGEVGGLPDGGDHRLARPAHGVGHGPDRRGLAGARGPPQQDRDPSGDSDAKGFDRAPLAHPSNVPRVIVLLPPPAAASDPPTHRHAGRAHGRPFEAARAKAVSVTGSSQPQRGMVSPAGNPRVRRFVGPAQGQEGRTRRRTRTATGRTPTA